MKELSIEEKARRYDEAIGKAKFKIKNDKDHVLYEDDVIEIFPELKESEDEKIRKGLIEYFLAGKCENISSYHGISTNDILAWLEKQGSKDNAKDIDILHRFSFYSYKDEPNVLYLSGLYVNEECRNKGIGTKILEVADEVAKSLNCHTIRLKTKKDSNAERLYRTHGYNSLATEERDEIWLEKKSEQNPADKVEPKFKVGDTIRLKNGDGLEWTVEEVLNNGYYTIVCADRDDFIQLDDNWELVEQKPAWSEEDEKNINFLRELLTDLQVKSTENEIKHGTNSRSEYYYDIKKWLKSLKDRVLPQPKWSEEVEKKNEDEAIRSNPIPELPSSAFRLGFKLGWFKVLKERVQSNQEWKQENTDDLTEFENALMHIGGSFFGQHAGLNPNDTNAIKEQANILLGLVSNQEFSKDDERNIKELLYLVESNYLSSEESHGRLIKFLESLRPQNTWKPSGEQIAAVKEAACYSSVFSEKTIDILFSLISDLKKLK